MEVVKHCFFDKNIFYDFHSWQILWSLKLDVLSQKHFVHRIQKTFIISQISYHGFFICHRRFRSRKEKHAFKSVIRYLQTTQIYTFACWIQWKLKQICAQQYKRKSFNKNDAHTLHWSASKARVMVICCKYNIKISMNSPCSTKEYWNFGYLREMHRDFADISNCTFLLLPLATLNQVITLASLLIIF